MYDAPDGMLWDNIYVAHSALKVVLFNHTNVLRIEPRTTLRTTFPQLLYKLITFASKHIV